MVIDNYVDNGLLRIPIEATCKVNQTSDGRHDTPARNAYLKPRVNANSDKKSCGTAVLRLSHRHAYGSLYIYKP